MADLKTAGQKFDDAISRLETALNTWSESADQKASDGQEERRQLKSELDRLKDDHTRVTREHQELQSRHDALKRVTESVSGELDATVGQLADLLEV